MHRLKMLTPYRYVDLIGLFPFGFGRTDGMRAVSLRGGHRRQHGRYAASELTFFVPVPIALQNRLSQIH